MGITEWHVYAGTKLNLGCGFRPKSGYLNCDRNSKAKEICDRNGCEFLYCDVKKSLRFVSVSCEEVCCENLFDSLASEQFENLMREIWRILIPGGKLVFHQGDVAVNPDMCFGWPGFVFGLTRNTFRFFTIGEAAHENWKDYSDYPGFCDVKIKHNDNGVMIGSMTKPL